MNQFISILLLISIINLNIVACVGKTNSNSNSTQKPYYIDNNTLVITSLSGLNEFYNKMNAHNNSVTKDQEFENFINSFNSIDISFLMKAHRSEFLENGNNFTENVVDKRQDIITSCPNVTTIFVDTKVTNDLEQEFPINGVSRIFEPNQEFDKEVYGDGREVSIITK